MPIHGHDGLTALETTTTRDLAEQTGEIRSGSSGKKNSRNGIMIEDILILTFSKGE
jgi:hypothetical protein